MNNLIKTQEAHDFIKRQLGNVSPKIGIVLGSGLSSFAEKLQNKVTIPYCDIPGFTECKVAGHVGALLLGSLGNNPVICLQGRAHYYEGKSHSDIQIPIRALKLLGCETLILTNAAASLRREVIPGSLVIINDHINFQFQNPLIGQNDECFGPRFPSLQKAYDEKLISLTTKVAHELDMKISSGVYLATLGPCYETPAEIRAFKLLGADVVGMSTVPEVIVARHCGLKVLAISIITNMACGMSEEYLTHEGVLKVANKAANDLTRLLINVIDKLEASK